MLMKKHSLEDFGELRLVGADRRGRQRLAHALRCLCAKVCHFTEAKHLQRRDLINGY